MSRIQLQPDWGEGLSDKQAGKVWVNILYPAESNMQNVYGFIKYNHAKQLVKEGLPEQLEIGNVVGTTSISFKFNNRNYKFYSASSTYSSLSNRKAVCICFFGINNIVDHFT